MGAHPTASFSFAATSAFRLTGKPSYPTNHIHISLPPAVRGCGRVRALNTDSGSGSGEGNETPLPLPPPEQAQAPAGQAVQIRFRRGSRKRSKQQQGNNNDVLRSNPSPPKDWDSMSISEKMAQLYAGEKGLLFWLNKVAYASIFIIIGGWILFRFVGPYLGLYQLESAPLSPPAMFKGS